MTERTHYADDDTLAYIDHLERELAEAKAERDENGRLADNAQDGWRKSLEERQKLASYAEERDRLLDQAQKAALHAQEHCMQAQQRAFKKAEEAERLRDVLHEARLQIEYLHSRSEITSTGVAVLARIEAALAAEGGL